MQNLNFVLMGSSPTGLTQIWNVQSVHTGIDLGVVKWYSSWRRYAFFPADTLFDAECLQEIVKFLDEQMLIRTLDRQLR
jgi:hypothetical protein